MTVGWYVHHHGRGHLHRFLAVRPQLPGVVGISSLPRPDGVPEDAWVELPLDLPEGEDPTANGTLHWVPLGVDGLRERMAAISAWLASARPRLLVIDVSVEVSLLARLHGVPTAIVLQRGRRDDAPHRLAFAQTRALLAPWTAESHLPEDGPDHPRLVHVGAISRFDGRKPASAAAGPPVLVAGAGGLDAPLGAPAGWERADGERDPWPLIQRASVVVGTGGGNVVAEVAAARRPFVCLPQSRPFDEQARGAEALRRLDLAEVLDAPPADWAPVLERARARDPRSWSRWHDGRGAQRLAQAVRDLCA